MKLFSHLFAFLTGALTVALSMILLLLKGIKPVINASTYVEKVENELKKLKIQGNDNDPSLTVAIAKENKPKPRRLLGIIKLKPKKKP